MCHSSRRLSTCGACCAARSWRFGVEYCDIGGRRPIRETRPSRRREAVERREGCPSGDLQPRIRQRDRRLRRDGHERREAAAERSEERRVGKACVSKCRFRGSQYHIKKKNEQKIEESPTN